MEPPPPQRRRITAAAATQEPRSILDVLPDDLLLQIFLRLDSPLWLVRAACACRPFRRAVVSGGRAFLRLAASLHPPAVVGHYHDRSGRQITFVPSSTPPPIDGGRFSLNFLPRPLVTTTDWEVADCHGGLVLLKNYSLPCNFIVCDPLTRRYQGIHHCPLVKQQGGYNAYAFALLDGEDGDISISNFRVLHRFLFHIHPSRFGVFSTADGGRWRFPRQAADYAGYAYVAGRVDGSIYLASSSPGNLKLKVLDSASLESSEVEMPTRIDTSEIPHSSSRFAVVHGGPGPDPTSPPSTSIIHLHGETLEFFRRVCGGSGEWSWVLEHTIPKLSEEARGLQGFPEKKRLQWDGVGVISVGVGTAVLSVKDRHKSMCLFSVAMDTKKLQVVPKEAYRRTTRIFTYALPWQHFLRACPPTS